MLNESQRFLLALVRSALGNNGADLSCFKVNWGEVYSIAQKQGVHGVIFDSLEKLPFNYRPPQALLLQWISQISIMERTYKSYVSVIGEFAEFLGKQGLFVMLMKGYGCSLNYPQPSHRPCGDIDVFVMTHRGNHNKRIVELVNKVITEKSIGRLVYDTEHHTVIQFGNFLIENHETILDVNTHKSSRFLNELLEALAKESIVGKSFVNGFMLPSVKFNSIHLLRHMANDFATFKTTLRNLLDWSTFVSRNAKAMDWPFVYEVARKANMHRFLDAINGICVDSLGYDPELFPVQSKNDALCDRILADIFQPEFQWRIPEMNNKLMYVWVKTCRMWQNRWKYKIVYDESLFSSFISLACNRIRRM